MMHDELDACMLLLSRNSVFLGISINRLAEDKSPLGDSYVFRWFWGFWEGTAWRHTPGCQAMHLI